MHIGLADFAERTLLILGDATSMRLLAGCIEARESLDLSTLPFVESVNVCVLMKPTGDNSSLDQKDTLFEWRISPLDSHQFAEQLRALAASDMPAHAYLDCKTSGEAVQVMASKGEYEAGDVLGPTAGRSTT
ncbi:hypothetical protein GCM10023165_09500 [Variovorax defluvii]|uniref:Uncharacterized protein n=1 Tax=Variovorax defluvii TaxID=913761 RepID=A0ABP8H3V2_9BURK